MSPAGRGPEAAAGAEPQRAGGAGERALLAGGEAAAQKLCEREGGREQEEERERSAGSAPFIARALAGRQPWDGMGRDGTWRKPAGARIAPSSGARGRLLAPSSPFPRGGGGSSSSGLGAPRPGREGSEIARSPGSVRGGMRRGGAAAKGERAASPLPHPSRTRCRPIAAPASPRGKVRFVAAAQRSSERALASPHLSTLCF